VAGLGAGLWILAAAALASRAYAATWTITTLADGVAADGACTLREAVRAAQSDAAVNECAAGSAADTIVMEAVGSYPFAAGDELFTTGSLHIRGATSEPASHVVNLGDQNRFLRVESGAQVTLERITLLDGNAFAPADGLGGALRVDEANLTLRDLLVQSCRAAFGGGLLFRTFGSQHLRLERTRFVGNQAGGQPDSTGAEGGAAWILAQGLSTVVIAEVELVNNAGIATGPGSTGSGGAIYAALGSQASGSIRHATFAGNTLAAASASGAGLDLDGSGPASWVVEDVVFRNNSLSGQASPGQPEALEAGAFGGSTLTLRRLHLVANGEQSSTGVQARIFGSDLAAVLVSDLLVAGGGAGTGLTASASAGATLLLGQLTVSGHTSQGLTLSGVGSSPRLEGSILWGNGSGDMGDDLALIGTTDTDRVTNHNWVGDQGDPDPLFVDATTGDYSLQALSEATDAGDKTFASVGPFDADHSPRVVGPEIDLGAFESGGIFGDDFESGTLGFWSRVQP
jgi:CSLREA domain-containing protein